MRLIQTGPRDAKMVLVGEAPGETEDATGRPFEGGAGQLLDWMLDRAKIRRNECFITNVCHTRPPDNDFAWFLKKQNQIHYLRGVLQLQKDLQSIRPNVVVGLGARPLLVLTGKTSVEKWRGSILESSLVKGLKVVSTYHPASVMRVYDYKAIVEHDLRRAADESLSSELSLPRRDHILHPDNSSRSAIVEEMLHAEWLAIDIECWQGAGGQWRLACVGFSDRGSRSLVIHNDGPASRFEIHRLCTCPAKKVFQNGTFDVTVLRDEGIEVVNFAWDTMLAHHARFPECASGADEFSAQSGRKRQAALAKGLAFQASFYTREPFYKDDGKIWRETNDLRTFWLYNGRDAAVTREIRDVQEVEITEFKVQSTFARRMALIEPTLASTRRGIRIDLAVRDQLKTSIEAEIVAFQQELDVAAGEPINVKSWPQVRKLLYEKLQLPVQYKRGTSDITSDKDALLNLGKRYQHPALHAILKIRERRDLVERYLSATVDADGRMRCSWDITGTRNGRLSSRASIYGSGTNLQNIPARRKEGEAIRRMFVADEGKVLLVRDYSQAEVWLVAHLARCQKLIELLNDPTRDIHRETACGIFGCRIDEVTEMQRFLAKRTVHSSNYGVGGEHLADKVNEDAEVTGITITAEEGDGVIQAYFLLYPEIKENFWREVEQELRYTRTLTTPLGMKREFYGRADFKSQSKFLREAYSFIPQSTVGELGGIAWCNAYHQIEKGRPDLCCDVLLNVHDSIMVQCAATKAHETKDALAEAMNIPITVHNITFTIPSDVKVGLNWASAGPDNPNGLRKWEKGGEEWLNDYCRVG